MGMHGHDKYHEDGTSITEFETILRPREGDGTVLPGQKASERPHWHLLMSSYSQALPGLSTVAGNSSFFDWSCLHFRFEFI